MRPEIGEHHVTIDLIDWKRRQENDFAIAEEVTVLGVHTKRPDLVRYVNGIALIVHFTLDRSDHLTTIRSTCSDVPR